MGTNQIFFHTPANIAFWGSDGWNHALPVGNGRLGAMVFGGHETERIQLNEDTLWSGSLNRNRINPDSLNNYKQVRQLLLEGSIEQAQKLSRRAMFAPLENECSYSTAGDLVIDFDWFCKEKKNYTRSLDLDTAIVTVSYQIENTQIIEEVFSDAIHQMIVVHIKAFDLTTNEDANVITCAASLTRGNHPDFNQAIACDTILLSGKECGEQAIRYAVAVKANQVGGFLSTLGKQLLIENASEVTFHIAIQTSFHHEDPKSVCLNQLTEMDPSFPCEKHNSISQYEEMKASHVSDYQSYFHRMMLTMDSDSSVESLPTNERLSRVMQGEIDLGLIALYYNFGRYLLISCSRPHTMAANLQGIWNNDLIPPWGCKYTININTQMNYWPAEGCNLSDCHGPLFDLIKRMLPSGRKVAREMYGCNGFMAHHNTDICGDCAPQDEWMPATIWPMGAAWLCTHIWTHYSYTLDKDFLAEFYPILCEASLFFTEYMFFNQQGQLVTGPSTSPENTYLHPSGEQGSTCIGPSMDSEILHDLFQSCIEAAAILQKEDSLQRN